MVAKYIRGRLAEHSPSELRVGLAIDELIIADIGEAGIRIHLFECCGRRSDRSASPSTYSA
jgi:hypothetical protein